MNLETFKEMCGDYTSEKHINLNHHQTSDLDKLFDDAMEAGITRELHRKQARFAIHSYFTGYNTGTKVGF